jgi:PAS domain S-box-containing protein
MKSDDKTKEQLLKEIDFLKAKIGELEKSEIDRKQAKEAQRESEEKYRANYDNIPLSYQSLDEDGCFIAVNPAWLKTLGYQKEEVIGKWFGDFLHPDWKPHFEKNFPEFKKRGYVHDVQFKIRHKDGHYLDISFEGRIGYTLDGKFKQTYCVFQDITKRKQVEEALQESEQNFRDLVGNLLDGVAIADENAYHIYVNPKFSKITGYSEDELLSMTGWDFTRPEDRAKLKQRMKDRMAGNPVQTHYDRIIVRKDGTEVPVEMSTTVTTWRGKKRPLAVVHDITERKRAEKALRIERDNLKNIFEAMEDGIYIVNQQYDIQYVNPVLIKDFGPYEGHKCYAYFHDRDDVCPWCKNIDVFAGKTVRWEWYSFKNQRTYDLIDTPLKNSDGSISKVEIFRDITERKQMEEQLKKSLKEKEILIKEIYHRVKNNLAVVSGLLNIQAANIKDKKVKAAFQATRDRIFSLSAVHSQLYHSENYSYVDYKEYIKKLVSNVFYSSQMSGHVKLHLDLDDISLPIDKAIPCGLLLNEIVTNALKHAFPENRKGNLRIIAHSLEDKKCEIIVKDDGIGIPESFNIEKTKTLGLKLIDLMAKQIEGTLEIESKKGTEFRIRLSTESGQVIR